MLSMGFCGVCGKDIEANIVIHCIDCWGVLCEDCSYAAVHCFDCGGILCSNCDAVGLCQNCEMVMILEEDFFDEEIW